MSSICQICLKNPATAHLAEIADPSGDLRELHLCNTCINRYHLDLPNNPLPISEILDLAAAIISEDPDDEIVKSSKSVIHIDLDDEDQIPPCPNCGLTFAEFTHNNRFGCAQDYEAFNQQLCDLFHELHDADQHIGRGPSCSDQQSQLLATRIRLEKRLQDVIAEERFEEAASIRDKIKELDL